MTTTASPMLAMLIANEAAHKARDYQAEAATAYGIIRHICAADKRSSSLVYCEGYDLTLRHHGPAGWQATQDGQPAQYWAWHEGAESVEQVYYERFNDAGDRLGHGYVDCFTRLLVQAG